MSNNDRPIVLITNAPPADHYTPLHDVAEVVVGRPVNQPLMTRDEVLALAPRLSGIINQAELKVDAELLDAAPNLKIVANVAMGTDNLDLDLMANRGVWATNVEGVFADSTADCAMGMLLCLARRLAESDRYVRSDQWPGDGFQPGAWDGMLLAGKTLGIVGFGRIGQGVARRADAFGMEVLFHDPAQKDEARYRELDELFAVADAISLHVPLIKQTHHLINAERLAAMKPGALLLNLSRGPVVDESALIVALENQSIAGAALDVFEHEPQVPEALCKRENVVLTAHLGGATREARRAARLLCSENVAAVLQGQTPPSAVNQVNEDS